MDDVAKITNGQHFEPQDFDAIADAAREICSYCEGEMRVAVYNKAKSVLRRERMKAYDEGLAVRAHILEKG